MIWKKKSVNVSNLNTNDMNVNRNPKLKWRLKNYANKNRDRKNANVLYYR